MPTDTTWAELTDDNAGDRITLRFPWDPDTAATFVFDHTEGPGQPQVAERDPETNDPIRYRDTWVHHMLWPEGEVGGFTLPADLPVTVDSGDGADSTA